MSLADVVRAIKRVQPHVLDFDPNPPSGRTNPDAPANNHETSTRYIVIDPILSALGWDLSNPDQCIVEYRVWDDAGDRGFVDYALFDRDGVPVIVVSAKRINVHSLKDENFDQIRRYLEGADAAEVAVITNGRYWEIGLLNEDGEWEPESDRALGLHWHKIGETAERLYTHLAKEIYW